ncbi:MAG: energy transducer TonB [Deltaproteobacteria bacterium]|nr:MAG: energy transducer TonB [Deltaproteobacteria bacterium]
MEATLPRKAGYAAAVLAASLLVHAGLVLLVGKARPFSAAPRQTAKEVTDKPVVLPGITLESTTQGGTFAAPTGNTLYGEPPRKAVEPGTAKPYKAEKYVAAAQVSELPSIDFTPDLKQFYPRDAQHRNIEGDVVLRILVDSDGSLAKVDVISEPGQGLGAAGARAIRAFRFRPGKLGGTPVATTITFTLQFRLE